MRINLSIKKNPDSVTDISEETAVAYLRDMEVNTTFNIGQSFYVKIGTVICEGSVANIVIGKKEA